MLCLVSHAACYKRVTFLWCRHIVMELEVAHVCETSEVARLCVGVSDAQELVRIQGRR